MPGGLLGPPPRLKGGVYDPDGFPVDVSRPVLKNKDGSISTEETVTINLDGRFYNVPTIWGGQRVSPQFAETAAREMMGSGLLNVPNFQTLDEALAAAKRRTEFLGLLRVPKK